MAEGLRRAPRQRHGRETVWPYFYAGTMGLVQRDGIDRLRHAMRYSREHSTICVALSDAGWLAGVGVKRGVDAREIAESDLIVVWGGNPGRDPGQCDDPYRAGPARSAARTLVVVDPYRTGTAEVADIHLVPRPGTDGALACAVMHVLFKEGFADRDYLARYTDVPGRARGASRRAATPDWAAAITGVPAATIVDFARLYGRTKRSFIRVGYGFSPLAQRRRPAPCRHLPAGGDRRLALCAAAARSTAMAGSIALDQTADRGARRARSGDAASSTSRASAPVLTGDRRDLGDGPPVTALLIQNTNPMVVCPDSTKVRAGLRARRSLRLRPRAVHDRDRRNGRYRAAGDDLPGA